MDNMTPPKPVEDIMTPEDSLERVDTIPVTQSPGINQNYTTSRSVVSSVNAQSATSLSATSSSAPSSLGSRPNSRQKNLFNKVGVTSLVLLGFMLLMVGGVFGYQKLHTPSPTAADQLAKIKDQTVQLSQEGIGNNTSSLRPGVSTMYVNGDISLQGVLRVSNGTTGYGQFDSSDLTGKQTYKLPNASGTICLDSGNCAGTTGAQIAALNAQLAALGLDVAAIDTTSTTTTAATNGGVQKLNGLTGTISLQGTSNQIIVTDANGTITFALPQDINSTSSPTFAGLTLNGTATQNGYQLCDDSNNCGFARGDMAILQGGNSYSTNIIVGAYDNFGLSLITNNTNRLSITNNGLITVGGATTDRVRVLGEIGGSSPFVFQGATDNFFRTTLQVTDPTANRNIILPNADGTVCLTSGNCSGAGGYGDVLNGGNTFNSAITLGTNDNYGLNLKTFNTNRVTISNTGAISLLGDTSISANATLGASSSSRIKVLGQVLGGTPLVFQGATNDSFATSFVISDPTANRTIIFPNADGTVCLTSGNCAGLGGSGDVLQGGNNFGATMVLGSSDNFDLELKTNGVTRLSITNTGDATFSAGLSVNGSTTLGDANTDRVTINGQILGGTPLVFQGVTDNGFATFFTVADPTANRTITLPNADGTICLSSGNCSTSGGTGDVNNGGNNYNSTMVLGTNDNFGLTLKTNNTNRITIDNNGLTTVVADFVVDGNTLFGADASNSTTLQGGDLFAPNNLNIDTYTQYIDTLNNTVGFGVIPGSTARVNILAVTGGDALTVNNGNGSGNILNLQDNGVNVVTVANNGVTTFKNSTDSTSAFQIQNTIGNTLLNADTTNRSVNINGGPSTFSFTASGDMLINRTEYTTSGNAFGPGNVRLVDLNNDTWADIITTGQGFVSVLMNNGNGTFANKVDYTTNITDAMGLATADFNSDGFLDVVISSDGVTGTDDFAVLMNNMNGTFGSASMYSSGVVSGKMSVVAADFNGDGKADFAASSNLSNNIAVMFMNSGTGSFNAPITGFGAGTGSGAATQVIAPDLDNDGDPDLVVSAQNQATFGVFMNNGNGTFGSRINYSTPGTTQGFTSGDVNGDSYPDVMYSAAGTNDSVQVRLNNGDGTLAAPVGYNIGLVSAGNVFLSNLKLDDFNSDGINDILAANFASGTVSILINNGNGTFATQQQYTAGNGPAFVDTADVNHDGKRDAVVVSVVSNTNKLSIMFGNGGTITQSNSLSVLPATVNHTGLYVKSNVGQTAELIKVVDATGANTMFSINGTGAAVFRNGTDSLNAFQLQTSSGSTALNFDSTNNKISLYNTGSTTMGNFTQLSTTLPAARSGHSTVIYNGYIYSVGGTGGVSTVSYATVAGGNTGTWLSTTSLPVNLSLSSVFVANGYLYAVGGFTNSATATTYYAQINGNGTIGAWNTTTSLPAARYGAATVTNNGYVYILGGADSSHSATTTVYYATLNSNGTIGAWQTGTALTQSLRFAQAVMHDGYLYVMGGNGGGNTSLNTIYYATPNSNGSLGSWTTSGVTLPAAMQSAGLFSYNSKIYYIGGCSGPLSSGDGCFFAPASPLVYEVSTSVGGALNAWQLSSTSSVLGGRAAFGLAVSGGYAYITGGYLPGGTATSMVMSAALAGSNSGTNFTSTSATFNTSVYVQNADNTYLLTANPGNNTLTVGATTTFKNITDSTTALQVQNAAGTTLLLADTVNNTINVMNSTVSSLGAWQTAGNHPSARASAATVTYNGYIYNIGGTVAGGAGSNNVYYSKLDVTGAPGTWNSATSLPDLRSAHTAAVANGYLYVIGGNDDVSTLTTVNYAKINSDGSLGAWNTSANPLPEARQNHATVIANGYLYVIGGTVSGTGPANIRSTVLYAALNADGSNGSWTTNANALPANRYKASAVVSSNGYLYVIGGAVSGGSAQSTVYYGLINSGDGSVGTWTTSANALPSVNYTQSTVVSNGIVYVLGGNNGSAINTVSYATLNGGGSTTTWQTATALPGARYSAGAVVANGYVYLVNGSDGTSNQSSVYYSQLPGGRTGSVFGAYSNTITGALYVQNTDGSSFVNADTATSNLAVNGSVNVSSGLTVQSGGLNNIGLIVKGVVSQNANLQEWQTNTGAVVGSVGANGQLNIGSTTPDATGTLLVLDNKNTAGDPAGTNGAMYYNSFSNKFRCYTNGTWADCGGGGLGGGDILQGGNSLAADVTIGTNDAYALNFEVNNTTVQTLSSTGQATFKNVSDSATAFRIQNASSINMFSVDTTNNQIQIGEPVADATGTLLVLDTKNTAGDPTGTNGAMYYNSNLGKFRCYEAGIWKDCAGAAGVGTGDVLHTGNTFGSQISLGTQDAFGLNLITSNATRLSVSATGAVAVNSAGAAGTVEKFRVNTPTTVDNAANTILSTGGISDKALVLQGVSGQTAAVFEVQNNTGTAVVSILAAGGSVRAGSFGSTTASKALLTANGDTGGFLLGTSNDANKGLVVRGFSATQSANLQDWQTSNGITRVGVTATGEFRIYDSTGTESTRFISATNGGLTVQTTSASGVLTLNPDGGLVLGGTATGNVTVGRVSSDVPVAIRGAVTLTNVTNATVNLVVKGNATHTGNLQEWQNSAGTVLSQITAAGNLVTSAQIQTAAGSCATPAYSFTGDTGTGICQNGSQTIGFVTGGTTKAMLNNSTFAINSAGAPGTVEKLRVNTPTTVDNTANAIITAGAAANKALVVQGAASQTANLFEIQSSAGTVLSYIASTGSFRTSGSGVGAPAYSFASDTTTGFFGASAGQIGVSSSGTEVARFTSKGLEISSTGAVGTVEKLRVNTPTTVDNLAASILATGATTSKGLVVQGVASQTANLQEWQSSAGTVLNSINSTGDMVFGQAAHSITIASNTTVNGNGYALTIQGGGANGNGTGGDLNLYGGPPGAGAVGGGNVNISGASGFGSGGNVNITAGIGGVVQGAVTIQSGSNGGITYGATNINANGGRINLGTAVNSAKLSVVNDSNTTADVVLYLRGASGQTGNLQEWRSSAGVLLASVAANGDMTLATGSLDITAGSLKVAGVDRIDNTGSLVNVSYNGSTIAVAKGGTGATSFTPNGILFGDGTNAVQSTAAGNSGQCLIATTGAAPAWGSCAPASNGNVNQGGNNFGAAVTLGATDNFGINLLANNVAVARFSASGQATLQNSVDSVTAMQVQNAAGTSLFTVDSTNSRVYIGNPTADSTGTVLVLDTKNTSGDPTGVDGAMYYNSNLGKFRCYEEGEWKDCIYNNRVATKASDQTFNSTAYANVNNLSFGVVANKAYRLSCSLLVSVPSGTSGGNMSTTGPASPSQYTATFLKSLDQSSGDNYATSSSYDDASAATTFRVNTVSTGANRFIVSYNAVLVNGANAGTWQLRAKAVDGASSITFYANSSCNMQPL